MDLKRVAREKAAEEGVPLEDALWAVIRAMLREATKGDVAAAKLLGDWLCIKDAQELHLMHSGGLDGPTVPPAADLAAGIRKLAELGKDLLES